MFSWHLFFRLVIPGGYLLGSTVGGPMVDRWDFGQKICGLSLGSFTGLHPSRVISYDEKKQVGGVASCQVI